MADIVLNTNAFRVLLNEEIIKKIVRKGYHVFVAKCAWTKELKGVYKHLINLLYSSVKKLRKNFHVKKLEKDILPNSLKKKILNNDADDCDVQIANLAYNRYKKSGQKVRLISNDHCFQNTRQLFSRYGVEVENSGKLKNDC